MAYDSARQRIVLFGGSEYQSIYGDTWEWDGSSWTLVSSTGPSPRIFARMVYDEVRGKMVLFGGQTHYEGTLLNDTWEWDGTTWTQVAATGPSPRSEHYLVYDPVRAVVVLFGGGMWGDPYYLGDTWEYAGESWLQIETAGPSPRKNGGAFFDSDVQGVYVFAGETAEGVTAETWVYGPDTDGDGVCNPADCASANPSVWASPGEVGDVAFAADWTTMSWSSLATQAGAGTIYDVLQGDLAEFPVGSGAAETCLATDLDATSLDTGAPPGEGAGWYLLVRGRNVCASGSWGTTSSGTLRSSVACP